MSAEPEPVVALKGRYDDDRSLTVEPSFNHEVSVRLGGQAPIYLDALDLLHVVAAAVATVWGWSEDGDRPKEDQH